MTVVQDGDGDESPQNCRWRGSEMDRRYPRKPMVGVGAVIFRGQQVLLVQRGTEPAMGKWSLPGGLVELGESLHDAVRREVREEVGLDIQVLDLIVALDRVIFDAEGKIEYHYVLLDFLCSPETGEKPSPASDVKDCRFFALEELPLDNLTRGTEKVVREAFARHRGKSSRIYDPSL